MAKWQRCAGNRSDGKKCIFRGFIMLRGRYWCRRCAQRHNFPTQTAESLSAPLVPALTRPEIEKFYMYLLHEKYGEKKQIPTEVLRKAFPVLLREVMRLHGFPWKED